MKLLKEKLVEIKELLSKAKDVPPSPKPPKPPKPMSPDNIEAPQAPKPGQSTSKKDPKKMAEQLKDPGLKEEAMKEAKKLKEGVKFNSGGQWSLK